MMWWTESVRLEHEQREKAALKFWDVCKARDARLAATEKDRDNKRRRSNG